jgi:uncharacterized membrane protein
MRCAPVYGVSPRVPHAAVDNPSLSEHIVTRSARAPLILFATGLIALGVLVFVFHDFAEVWQPAAAWSRGHTALAYLSGVIMLLCGIGLLIERASGLSVRILLPFLLIGLLLQLSVAVRPPLVEANWEGAAEIAILLSGALILFGSRSPNALATDGTWLLVARFLFGVALLPIGLSHFSYIKDTSALVPAWLPFRTGWVYLTGTAHIAAGLGVLFSVVPRLAAMLEAAMLGAFTILVWAPKLFAAPTSRLVWTEFFISWAVTAAVWLVADSIPRRDAIR